MIKTSPISEGCRNLVASLKVQRVTPSSKPLPLPLETVQRATKGLRHSELTVCGGYEGNGKSVLCAQLAFSVAAQLKEDDSGIVLIETLEMPKEQILARYFATLSGVESEKFNDPSLLTDADEIAIAAVAEEVGTYPVEFVDDSQVTSDGIGGHIDDLQSDKPVKLVLVDYMGLLDDAGEDNKSLAYVSKRLKQIAREFKTHILSIHSLNRTLESTAIPSSKNLRGSGGIQFNADNIWILHQPYLMDAAAWGNEWENRAFFRVVKQRSGRIGDYVLGWEPENIRFVDLPEREQKNLVSLRPQTNQSQKLRFY